MLVYNVDGFTMVQMKLDENTGNETRRCDAVHHHIAVEAVNVYLTSL